MNKDRRMFEPDEIKGLSDPDRQQRSQQIKQRFDQKRGLYHQLRNQTEAIFHWKEIDAKITSFENDFFNPWNQRWGDVHRGNQEQQLIDYFNEAEKHYNEMDDFVITYAVPRTDSLEVESLKSEILKKIENDILNLKSDINSNLEKGINDLVGLKGELGLQKNFKENIEKELLASKLGKYVFLSLFIIAVSSIPVFIWITKETMIFKDFKDIDLMYLRIGATISLGVLSYFFFSQYRLQQLIGLRYTHLYGFLGGGATYIGQLAGNDEEVKRAINKKLAYLFIELDDISGLVKKSNHPAETTLEKVSELLASAIKKNG